MTSPITPNTERASPLITAQQPKFQHFSAASSSLVGSYGSTVTEPEPAMSKSGSFFSSRRSSSREKSDVSLSTAEKFSAANENLQHQAGQALSASLPTSASGYSLSILSRKSKSPEQLRKDAGLRGLQNLGNTCFMNSALQCMSNTPGLILGYFVPGKQASQINRTNPLGMQGDMANAFADLMQKIWLGNESSVSPRLFKHTIGRFAPQFKAYHQQDSQELLGFLLDGLHEDVNLVKVKPYVESPDETPKPDAVLAEEQWKIHKSRNDSVIVDFFQGQYRSRVRCHSCANESIKFDPYMILTLPIPCGAPKCIKVVLAPLDCELLSIDIYVNSEWRVSNLLELITNPKTKNTRYTVVEIFRGRVFKMYSPINSLNSLNSNDELVIYELPHTEDDCYNIPSTPSPEINSHPPIADTVVTPAPAASPAPRVCVFATPFDEDGMAIDIPVQVLLPSDFNEEENCQIIAHAICKRACLDIEKMKALIPSGKFSEVIEVAYMSSHVPRPDARRLKVLETLKVTFKSAEALRLIRNSPGFNPMATVTTVADALVKDHQSSDPTFSYLECRSRARVLLPVNKRRATSAGVPSSISLEDCIDAFTCEEHLDASEPVYCSKCKKHQQSSKKFDLWRVPPVLVFALKRFGHAGSYLRHKLSQYVDFPLELRMGDRVHVDSPQAERNAIYDLYAVSNHYGGMGSGHYTAYAKNPILSQWFEFDDACVSSVSVDKIRSPAAYVLFYARRGLDANFFSPVPGNTPVKLTENHPILNPSSHLHPTTAHASSTQAAGASSSAKHSSSDSNETKREASVNLDSEAMSVDDTAACPSSPHTYLQGQNNDSTSSPLSLEALKNWD